MRYSSCIDASLKIYSTILSKDHIQSVGDVGIRAAPSSCLMLLAGKLHHQARILRMPSRYCRNNESPSVRRSILSGAGGLVQVDGFAKDDMLADWPQQETSHANGHRPTKAKYSKARSCSLDFHCLTVARRAALLGPSGR